jgi:Domain of unknown function (DUF4389)
MVVADDLNRSRLTVFFRLLLAIPHYVWAFFWTLLMGVVVILNWFATLILGRSPGAFHRLTAAYVRYLTQLFAYLLLAANPYPMFTGTESYPVDLEIDKSAPQRRLITLFRLPLSLPALVFEAVFIVTYAGGSYSSSSGSQSDAYNAGATSSSVGILWTVALFAWFACLVLGRMPMGFRNLQAYGLRYLAQTWGYMLLLNDRYPNLDPVDPPSTGPLHPVGLAVTDELRRSRLTVFFRFLLTLPHFVWLILWGVAAFLAGIAGWFAALVLGRLPRPLHRFLAAYLHYSTHVFAFLFLTANPFPGFTGGPYPVDPELPEPERQKRLVIFFRLLLAFPAFAVSSSLYTLAAVAAFFGWFVALALGRMPRSFREAQAYALRYGVQTSAYAWLLTGRYPYSGPSLGQPEPEPSPEPGPELAPAEYPA